MAISTNIGGLELVSESSKRIRQRGKQEQFNAQKALSFNQAAGVRAAELEGALNTQRQLVQNQQNIRAADVRQEKQLTQQESQFGRELAFNKEQFARTQAFEASKLDALKEQNEKENRLQALSIAATVVVGYFGK